MVTNKVLFNYHILHLVTAQLLQPTPTLLQEQLAILNEVNFRLNILQWGDEAHRKGFACSRIAHTRSIPFMQILSAKHSSR